MAIFNGSYSHALVLNNDSILPPWFYSELLSYDAPFVTGVAIDKQPVAKPERMPLNPHPDFSAFLIRRDCWLTVGPFDERMKLYASDCDFHLRAHRLGIPLWKANVPYYHVNSQTLKRATPEDRAIIEAQANADRAVFKSIYGCLPGTAEYEALFKEGK
jgi:GT2 family glycosyltransferase